MSESLRKIILLGAPTSSSLNWNESCLLPQKHALHDTTNLSPFEGLESEGPQWRQLSSDALNWKIGLSGPFPHTPIFTPMTTQWNTTESNQVIPTTPGILTELFPDVEAPIDLTLDATPGEPADSLLSEFYNESFISDESFDLSQASSTNAQDSHESLQDPVPVQGTEKVFTEKHLGIPSFRQIPANVQLTDLKSVPSPSYLLSIQPQTMTINIVVGVIAIPAAVTVSRRKDGGYIDLVEMLVGDDTRSAFGISIWLPHGKGAGHMETESGTLKNQLAILRPTDVVLIRNMALASFRGKVHGQSLWRGITKIDLLYRRRIRGDESPGLLGTAIEGLGSSGNFDKADNRIMIEKARLVKEWLLHFVGYPTTNHADVPGRLSAGKGGKVLPPDTQ